MVHPPKDYVPYRHRDLVPDPKIPTWVWFALVAAVVAFATCLYVVLS
jgi:hypothetical protein